MTGSTSTLTAHFLHLLSIHGFENLLTFSLVFTTRFFISSSSHLQTLLQVKRHQKTHFTLCVSATISTLALMRHSFTRMTTGGELPDPNDPRSTTYAHHAKDSRRKVKKQGKQASSEQHQYFAIPMGVANPAKSLLSVIRLLKIKMIKRLLTRPYVNLYVISQTHPQRFSY